MSGISLLENGSSTKLRTAVQCGSYEPASKENTFTIVEGFANIATRLLSGIGLPTWLRGEAIMLEQVLSRDFRFRKLVHAGSPEDQFVRLTRTERQASLRLSQCGALPIPNRELAGSVRASSR